MGWDGAGQGAWLSYTVPGQGEPAEQPWLSTPVLVQEQHTPLRPAQCQQGRNLCEPLPVISTCNCRHSLISRTSELGIPGCLTALTLFLCRTTRLPVQ